jgi:hypothetical protein
LPPWPPVPSVPGLPSESDPGVPASTQSKPIWTRPPHPTRRIIQQQAFASRIRASSTLLVAPLLIWLELLSIMTQSTELDGLALARPPTEQRAVAMLFST